MLERFLGPTAIIDEALDQLVDDALREAMREQDLVPLTSPRSRSLRAKRASRSSLQGHRPGETRSRAR